MSFSFPSASCPRPVRLSERTREFARESLSGKYGRALKATPFVPLDDIPGFEALSPYDKYDAAITRIAETAPVRIAPGELIRGSATLIEAVHHVVPGFFGGKALFSSVSHLTCDFARVLREGADGFLDEINARLALPADAEQQRFLKSLLNVYEALKIWHGRYISALEALAGDRSGTAYETNLENLRSVPFSPPRSFAEALQSLWFTFAFIRLCGNWPGIGRLDEMLGPFLEKDLASGKITEDMAREYLAHFFIKGCEWVTLDNVGSGDAQHYQNIVLAGVDGDGEPVTGTVTRLILEVLEELPISDFPVAVRLSPDSPEWLTEAMARVIRHGGGVVAAYNEPLIIDSLTGFGYPLREAREFANDGCWEVQIPGMTCFTYRPFDAHRLLLNDVLGLNEKGPENRRYESYDEIYNEYLKCLDRSIDEFHSSADGFGKDKTPCSVVSFFETGCAQSARSYLDGGPVYTCLSPHPGGLPDAVNSLYAIKKLVFNEKRITLDEFLSVLKRNWEGSEPLRRYVRTAYSYYGNDNPEVDEIMNGILSHYIAYARRVKERAGVKRPPGISTFGRQIEWRNDRTASPHGFFSGDILSGNLSPTPSTDKNGPTAVIRSHCSADFSGLTCGTALDMKLDPSAVQGPAGIKAIRSLLTGFVTLGGFFIQIDVVDAAVLEDAQKHPENYQNLAVRVSGWSARFITLDKNWQRMIIERAKSSR